MSGALNDGLRWLIGALASACGALLSIRQRFSMFTYRVRHRRLGRRFGVERTTAIESYGPDTEMRIDEVAARTREPVTFALTSGSSARPKRMLYTPARVRALKRAYIDVFCRLFWAFPIKRRSLFVMSGLGNGESLTAQLLAETGRVSRFALLQAPYRILSAPVMRELIAGYGMTAVRLLLLTQTNPGILYATNPSTLSTFFDEVAAEWTKSTRLVRDVHERPQALAPAVRRILASLSSRGSRWRIAAIARSDRSLPVAAWLPGLEAYVCWTGGYVAPFLDRLALHLPPGRYRRIPMYSMSTETIETVTHFPHRHGDDTAFFPMGAGTLYELLPEGDPDRPERLLPPWKAEAGRDFTLVVSNAFGLRRYQTDDLFRCERVMAGLPDLRFLRRRALEHSFTGEKVTAEQLALVFGEVRASLPVPGAVAFLTCLPSQPPDEHVPHYRLVLVATAAATAPPALDVDALAADVDRRLSAINSEYHDKVLSGRLRPMRGVRMELPALVTLIGGDHHRLDWEAQLKFLPLYARTWESFSAAAKA